MAQSEGVRLLVVLEKCLIAYRKMLDRPFFSLTLRTASGQPLELVHNTPPGYYNQEAGAISAKPCCALENARCTHPPGCVLKGKARRAFGTLANRKVLLASPAGLRLGYLSCTLLYIIWCSGKHARYCSVQADKGAILFMLLEFYLRCQWSPQ